MAFDEEELGVFSSRLVVHDRMPVLLVFHEDDGDWQFLTGGEEHPGECIFVHGLGPAEVGRARLRLCG